MATPRTPTANPNLSLAELRTQRAKLASLLEKYRRPFEQKLQRVIDGELSATEFLGLKPQHAVGLVGFAAQMLSENDLDSAEAAAELAAAADPSSFDAWMTLGATRARRKQERAALEAYAQAAAIRPTDVRLWCDVGEIKLLLHDYEGAAKALRLAMDADPQAQTPAGRRAQALVAKTFAKIKKK